MNERGLEWFINLIGAQQVEIAILREHNTALMTELRRLQTHEAEHSHGEEEEDGD